MMVITLTKSIMFIRSLLDLLIYGADETEINTHFDDDISHDDEKHRTIREKSYYIDKRYDYQPYYYSNDKKIEKIKKINKFGELMHNMIYRSINDYDMLIDIDANLFLHMNQSEMTDLQFMNVVKKNGLLLQCIENQTYEICYEAVKNNGFSIKYVNDNILDENICIEAIKQNLFAFKYVKEECKTTDVYYLIIKKLQELNPLINEHNKNNLIECYELMKYVTTDDEHICMLFVEWSPNFLMFSKCKTHDICMKAVKNKGFLLEYVSEQTHDIQQYY